jgi:AraC family transcriptional regulator
MDPRKIEAVIAKRFGLPRAPTLVARVAAPKLPVVFTYLRSTDTQRRQTADVPREQSFSFQVPLIPFPWRAWFAGTEKAVSAATPGNAYLFDLSDNPTVGLNTPFNTVRLNISQRALDALADESELRRPGGLHAPSLGCPDAVMHGLAQALVAAMEQPGEATSLFVEHVAIAFHAHVLQTYGNIPVASLSVRGGLAPWQLRRAYDFIDANISNDPSISEVADQCGLSSSYFSRAFKRESGFSPHQWLMKRRVERAKELLRQPHLHLAEIAQTCGFVDQSHFARVFSKKEGFSPGRWRRLHRSP